MVEVSEASLEELRAAMARMPSYQRTAIRWLARELELGRAPEASGGTSQGPGQERAMRRALLERSQLERAIASSSSTPEQKAFLQQNVAHLWRALLEARTPCPSATKPTLR